MINKQKRYAVIRWFILVFVMVMLGSCAAGPDGIKEKRVYRIGYMICNSEQETLQRFRPLTAYLSARLGVEFEAVAIDTINFARQIDELDFTHTNSLLYVILKRFNGVELLAGEKAGSLGSRTKGAIVVPSQSQIRTLNDLKGRTMLFGPMYAPSAYLTQMDMLLRAGLDPEEDLAFYSIPSGSFKHEKVIYGVLFNRAEAGAFPMLDLERMIEAGKVSSDDFRVIAEGEAIPYCTFAATQKADEDMALAMQKVLLSIKKDDTVEIDGERIRVLDRAMIDGYEMARDSDYDSVRDMARRTNMPPYQDY